MAKLVYAFGGGVADGRAGDKALLGGKGANLAEMTALGIPVPPGFTISTDVCRHAMAHGGDYPASLRADVDAALARVGELTGDRFGDPARPLLVSVRSGAPASMPGMMDTILNLGLNDDTVAGLAAHSGSPRFAWDCYRRFVAMYGEVVLGGRRGRARRLAVRAHPRATRRPRPACAATASSVRGVAARVVAASKAAVLDRDRRRVPRRRTRPALGRHRRGVPLVGQPARRRVPQHARHPATMGTAVNVQAMVFGNMGDDCGHRRGLHPRPVDRRQGAVRRVPAQRPGRGRGRRHPDAAADQHRQLAQSHEVTRGPCRRSTPSWRALPRARAHYRDMQDIEFTDPAGRLWMLQTRTGKRTGAPRCESLSTWRTRASSRGRGVLRVRPDARRACCTRSIDPSAKRAGARARAWERRPARPRARSSSPPTTPGAARRGEAVILVRTETSPEDIHGMLRRPSASSPRAAA
jgi:pyruvate,orthophosphate dikinase